MGAGEAGPQALSGAEGPTCTLTGAWDVRGKGADAGAWSFTPRLLEKQGRGAHRPAPGPGSQAESASCGATPLPPGLGAPLAAGDHWVFEEPGTLRTDQAWRGPACLGALWRNLQVWEKASCLLSSFFTKEERPRVRRAGPGLSRLLRRRRCEPGRPAGGSGPPPGAAKPVAEFHSSTAFPRTSLQSTQTGTHFPESACSSC